MVILSTQNPFRTTWHIYIWSSITVAIVSWCILYSFNWTADLGVQRSEIWQNEDPSFSLDVDKMPMKDPPKQRSLRGNIYRFPMVSHGFPGFSQEINSFICFPLYVFLDIVPSSHGFNPGEQPRWPSDNAQTQLVLRKRRDRTLQGEDFIGNLLPRISIHRNAWWEFHLKCLEFIHKKYHDP